MRSFNRKLCTALAASLIISILGIPAIAVYELATDRSGEAIKTTIVVDEAQPVAADSGEGPNTGLVSLDTTFSSVILSLNSYPSSRAEVAVLVNGRNCDPDQLSFIINDVAYAPLRDLCKALGAKDIQFNADTKTATVRSDGLELVIPLDEPYLIANGRYLFVENGFILKAEKTMVPIRTICQTFGAKLEWDSKNSAVRITTGGSPIENGSTYYDDDDVYWLTRIIHAESGSEPFIGQIAVGNVIVNRVNDPAYPSSVHDVIFDNRYGVQFTPTINGAIYSNPSGCTCEIAAKLALDGATVVNDAKYFSSAYASCWASRNRPYVTQIGSHAFYA